jgi:DNA topoisomerase-1
MSPDEVTLEQAIALLDLPRVIGQHPETGKRIEAGIGRFGPYVRHDGNYRSLAKTDDVFTIGMDRALELLAQAKGRRRAVVLRELGPHPDDGEPVALYEGRYGPYVKHGKINASLPKGTSADEIALETALKLLEEKAKKSKRRKSRKSKKKK